MSDETKMPWDALPGGRYIQGGRADTKTGKHYGGRVVNAHGEVLHVYKDDEENPGYAPEDKPKVPPRPPAPPAK